MSERERDRSAHVGWREIGGFDRADDDELWADERCKLRRSERYIYINIYYCNYPHVQFNCLLFTVRLMRYDGGIEWICDVSSCVLEIGIIEVIVDLSIRIVRLNYLYTANGLRGNTPCVLIV